MSNSIRMILLVAASLIWNASSCELECTNCLEAQLLLIPEDYYMEVAKKDFPFHSITNLESNEEVWNIDFLSTTDTIYIRSYEYVLLPLHPNEKISSFDFRDASGNSIGNVVFEVDFETVYSEGCKDYKLHIAEDPIIDIDLENLDIILNSDYSYPCLPTLELRL